MAILPTPGQGKTPPNPLGVGAEDDLQVSGVGSLLGLNWGDVPVSQATSALSKLATSAEKDPTAKAALAQLQDELYTAGYYGTKKPTLGTLSGGNADETAFRKALVDASNSGQPIGTFLSQASQNAAKTGSVGTQSPPAITEKQQVFNPGDIQGTVNSTAQTLLGRNATPGELQHITDLLNSQSAASTNADVQNSEATAANSDENAKGNTDVDSFLAAVKSHESGGDYTATNPNGGASGAYQYIQSTWTSEAKSAGFAQYANGPASAAPPAVQDAVARQNALNLYQQYGNWKDAAEGWYDPAYVGQDDYVPAGNNGLSIGKYGDDIVNLMNQNGTTPQGVSAVVGTATNAVGQKSIDPQSHPGGQPLAGAATPGAIAKAEGQIGTPYVWGGTTPGGGFDCSGLVQWAYGQTGVNLPRVAQDQYNATTKVDPSEAKPGDLVFFGSGPKGVDHVGIYIGNDQMVVAPHTGTKVQIQSGVLEEKNLVGVTQVTANGMTPADWAALAKANNTPGAAGYLSAQANSAATAGNTPANNVTVTPTPAGADSVTDAATDVLENQEPGQFQQNNLLTTFDTINKALSQSSGPTAASANVLKNPISMNPETS